jgi:hypothetical protein
MVTHSVQRLVRSAEFRVLHARLVSKLEEMGDLGVLSGDELREVLEPGASDSDRCDCGWDR